MECQLSPAHSAMIISYRARLITTKSTVFRATTCFGRLGNDTLYGDGGNENLDKGVSYSDPGAEALHAVGVSTPDANVSVLWLLMQTGIEYRLV